MVTFKMKYTLQFVNIIDLKHPHYIQTHTKGTIWGDVLMTFIVVIILWCKHISNYHVVHPKYNFVSHTPVNLCLINQYRFCII